jgi:hypothetical protein
LVREQRECRIGPRSSTSWLTALARSDCI